MSTVRNGKYVILILWILLSQLTVALLISHCIYIMNITGPQNTHQAATTHKSVLIIYLKLIVLFSLVSKAERISVIMMQIHIRFVFKSKNNLFISTWGFFYSVWNTYICYPRQAFPNVRSQGNQMHIIRFYFIGLDKTMGQFWSIHLCSVPRNSPFWVFHILQKINIFDQYV